MPVENSRFFLRRRWIEPALFQFFNDTGNNELLALGIDEQAGGNGEDYDHLPKMSFQLQMRWGFAMSPNAPGSAPQFH